MVTRRKSTNGSSGPEAKLGRRATTPQEREDQLINLAYDVVERKMLDGTASSQEITHFLKLGSSREKLEQLKLQQENELIGAKIEAIAAGQRIEELYEGAITAMRSYQGHPLEESDGYDD